MTKAGERLVIAAAKNARKVLHLTFEEAGKRALEYDKLFVPYFEANYPDASPPRRQSKKRSKP